MSRDAVALIVAGGARRAILSSAAAFPGIEEHGRVD